MHCGRAASKKKAGCLCFRRGTAATTVKMGSLRELQHALQEKNTEMKMKDSRILALEQELKRRNEIIRRLESELDKYRSVLQPAVARDRTRNQRQGISAEPQSYKTVTDASKPLKRHSKSSRQGWFNFFCIVATLSRWELDQWPSNLACYKRYWSAQPSVALWSFGVIVRLVEAFYREIHATIDDCDFLFRSVLSIFAVIVKPSRTPTQKIAAEIEQCMAETKH